MTQTSPSERPAGAALPELAQFDDDALRSLAAQIARQLSERDEARKRAAIERIRALAREAGLTVSVERGTRKRGRPRKSETAAS